MIEMCCQSSSQGLGRYQEILWSGRCLKGMSSNRIKVKATVEYVVGQDEVSAKPATLERKYIQWTKPALVWQLSYAFDHT